MNNTNEKSQLGLDGLGKKVYKENHIYLATFFGGPLAAGYMISENFKTFPDQQKAKTTIVVTIVGTIMIFTLAILLSDTIRIPIIIPLIYSFGARGLTLHYQGAGIKHILDSGGEYHKSGRVLAIAVISLAITVAVLFAVAMAVVTFLDMPLG